MTAPDPRLGEIAARSEYAMIHESLTASDYAEMAWDSARDVPYLLAVLADRDAKLARVEALHVEDEQGKCAECTVAPFSIHSVKYPCQTIRAAVADTTGGGGK